jgi:hypothetical protein
MSTASDVMEGFSPEDKKFGYLVLLAGTVTYGGYSKCKCEIRFIYGHKQLDIVVHLDDIQKFDRYYNIWIYSPDNPEMPILAYGAVRYNDEYLTPTCMTEMTYRDTMSKQLCHMMVQAVHVIIHRNVIYSPIPTDPNGKTRGTWGRGFSRKELFTIEHFSKVLFEDLIISTQALLQSA